MDNLHTRLLDDIKVKAKKAISSMNLNDKDFRNVATPLNVLQLVTVVQELRERETCLEKEADWLAAGILMCSYIAECGVIEDCQGSCRRNVDYWRECARKAVEKNQCTN